ncbi:MAG: hypothetical protein ACE5EE_04645 [Fidelibacterota bacterium]
MSLKAFHIFFIILSILMCMGLAIWSFLHAAESYTLFGIIASLVGFGLMYYLYRFLKKYKGLGYL